MSKETFCVRINHSWRIQLNPEGEGLLLVVDRGIPCEGHTQVISLHTTNTPGEEAVRRVVQRERDGLNNRIQAFVDFIRAVDGWDFKELIAVQFYHHLLGKIVREAVAEQCKIWDEKERQR